MAESVVMHDGSLVTSAQRSIEFLLGVDLNVVAIDEAANDSGRSVQVELDCLSENRSFVCVVDLESRRATLFADVEESEGFVMGSQRLAEAVVSLNGHVGRFDSV